MSLKTEVKSQLVGAREVLGSLPTMEKEVTENFINHKSGNIELKGFCIYQMASGYREMCFSDKNKRF